jgi:hypothetical protein
MMTEVRDLKRFIFLVAIVAMVAGLATVPTTAKAERLGQFGIQGGYSGDYDWFIGARSELGGSKLFERSRVALDFNWFFPGGKANLFDFDLNYHWPLTTLADNANSDMYIGGGANLGRSWVSDVDDSGNWSFGLNALGGLHWDLQGRAAFLEGGYTFFSDFDQWRITVGFLL